ncbi:hypothetical protein [Streptomyces pilosus]|uniref:hypothetical protein n=1 Tax=Streptomyces pilosus TaxID=28893 RepID=UPI003635202E
MPEKIRFPSPAQEGRAESRTASWPTRHTATARAVNICAARGIRHTIPEKIDSQAARLRKGARGGRPSGLDEGCYRKRNTVERAINKLKQFRAVASRYDKRGHVFLGTAVVAAIILICFANDRPGCGSAVSGGHPAVSSCVAS